MPRRTRQVLTAPSATTRRPTLRRCKRRHIDRPSPYRGSAPLTNDLLPTRYRGVRHDPEAANQIGRLRALAVGRKAQDRVAACRRWATRLTRVEIEAGSGCSCQPPHPRDGRSFRRTSPSSPRRGCPGSRRSASCRVRSGKRSKSSCAATTRMGRCREGNRRQGRVRRG